LRNTTSLGLTKVALDLPAPVVVTAGSIINPESLLALAVVVAKCQALSKSWD
jgi:hypothetical protein